MLLLKFSWLTVIKQTESQTANPTLTLRERTASKESDPLLGKAVFFKNMTTVISKRTKILNNEAADGEASLCCLSDSFFGGGGPQSPPIKKQTYALFADGSPAASPCEKNTRLTNTGSKIRLFLFIILVHFLTCFRN